MQPTLLLMRFSRMMACVIACPLAAMAATSVLRSDQNRFSFRYQPGQLVLATAADGRMQPGFDDADPLAEPGQWALPSKVVRIGIPQTGSVRLSAKTGPEERVNQVILASVPFMSWDRDTFWYEPPSVQSGFVPGSIVELGPVERFRDIRYVMVRLSPCQYDGTTRQLRTYQWIDVTVSFEHPAAEARRPDPTDGIAASLLLNGGQACDWKMDPPPRAVGQFERSPNWLKIVVDSTGIYRIRAEELVQAGVSLSGLDPATLALYTVGDRGPDGQYPDTMRAVAIGTYDGDDGSLDPGDFIVFYGLGPEHWVGRDSAYVRNFYRARNAYWLTWGGEPGPRMARGHGPDTAGTPVIHAAREVLRLEKDTDCPARSGLLWTWAQLLKLADRPVATFSTDLELSGPVQLKSLRGRVMADSTGNQLDVKFNNRLVGSFTFGQATPNSPYEFEVDTTLPAGFNENTVALELRGSGTKRLYLDYFTVEYTKRLTLSRGQLHFLQDDTGTFRFALDDVDEMPVILEVTDPYAPRLAEGFEWQGDSGRFCRRLTRPAEFAIACTSRLRKPLALELRHPGRLSSERRQADYWVITPREYSVPAQDLARYRVNRVSGIRHAVSDVAILEDVYDDYGFGLEEPFAVKRFLVDKRPAYGLLAGDATCDYRGILGKRPPGVPAYEYGFGLNPESYDRSAVAFDAWYADFEGEGGSPDMMLGRVTVRSAFEFKQFVDKLIAYETGPAGFWNKRYLLLADDEFSGYYGWVDPIGFGHIGQCEGMAVLPDDLLQPVKIYLTEWPYAGVKNKPGAHADLMRQMNLGGVVLVFFGHGSGFDLTHESVLNISQVPQIHNAGRAPFCFFGSCSVGRFDDTQFECIAEELVRKPDGGAIAAVGATKATNSGSNQVFARNLLTPLFTMPDSTIGSSFLRAWTTDRIYHLFGDPATVLRLPRASTQEVIVTPDSLRPGARFNAYANLEIDQADFDWVLFGPRRVRSYWSTQGQATYTLPGLEIARGRGKVRSGALECNGMFPLGVPLDTLFVANGSYTPVVGSCRLSVSAWNDSVDLAVLADTLRYAKEPRPHRDNAGPAVSLWFDGRRLSDGAPVPAEFELEAVLSDTAGVLVAPVAGAAPEFYVDERRNAIDLTDLLVFDAGSATTCRFRTPVSLSGPVDSLFVTASDNLLNRTVARVSVRPFGSDVLSADSVLVYPNPVRMDARFTFLLSRAAMVRIRVYTLAGRLIRDLGEVPAGFGFNQIHWDGWDRDGVQPANGVYLYTLTARAADGAGKVQSVTVRDKLLVLR